MSTAEATNGAGPVSAARSKNGAITRLRSWRPTARLAWRDARAHKARTLLAIFLVALPLAVVLSFATTPTIVGIPRDAALNCLPKGVQAVVTGTATESIIQDPEGARDAWIDRPDRAAITAERLARHIRTGNEAHQVMKSGNLLVSTDFRARLGTALPLDRDGSGDLSGSDFSRTGASNLIEADRQALKLLLPTLQAGQLPTNGEGVVITSSLAKQLGVSAGDTIDLMAPPAPSVKWESISATTHPKDSNAQVADVLNAAKRSYRVTGIVSSEERLVWALPGWLMEAAKAKTTGYSTTFLVTGPHPVTWQDAKALNKEGAFAVSRHVLTNYPDKARLYPERIYRADALSDLAGLLIGAGTGAILLLGLITPAFMVGAEQQRRILGLTAAIGASPRQLARVLTLQGVAVGAAGGILGSAGGLALLWADASYSRPGTPVFVNFSWWPLAIAIATTAVAGWFATLAPARSVARTPPVESLKRRAQTGTRKKRRSTLRSAVLAAVLLLSATVCAVLSVKNAATLGAEAEIMEIDSAFEDADDALVVSTLPSLLSIVGVGVLGLAGSFMLIRVLLDVASRRAVSGRMPPSVRLALREMHMHRGRTLPIIASVAVVVSFACAQVVEMASNRANEKDWSATMVAPGRMYLVPQVPVNGAFDASLVQAATKRLKQEGLPVEDARPVYSAGSQTLAILPPDRARCPEDRAVDSASALGYSKKIRCVPLPKAYNPAFDASTGDGSLLVMGGDALRATGMNGAEQAAKVLDRGGVVVGNATRMDEGGNVRVGRVDSLSMVGGVPVSASDALSTTRFTFSDSSDIKDVQSRPGHFLPRLNGDVAVSPQTAKELGLTGDNAPVYVGAVLSTSRPLTAGEVDRAKRIIAQNMGDMVVAHTGHNRSVPGSTRDYTTIGLYVVTALLALVLNLWLVRTQMRDELANMHAIGASPSLLRRTTMAHAAAVLAIGVPVGALAGWAFAAYLVVWNRNLALTGPWLHVEGAWAVQAAGLAALVTAGVGVAWMVARPARSPSLSRRGQ